MIEAREVVFEDASGIAIARMAGTFALQDGVHLIRDVIARAVDEGIARLMVVITETTGYPSPSLSMRLGIMREWADAARGRVTVVMVCRPELIDPNKFGVTMAANFGMHTEVFAHEDEAMAWLREQP